jgi:hypothetical protein
VNNRYVVARTSGWRGVGWKRRDGDEPVPAEYLVLDRAYGYQAVASYATDGREYVSLGTREEVHRFCSETAERHAAALNADREFFPPPWSLRDRPELAETVVELARAGLSLYAIGRRVQVPDKTLSKWLVRTLGRRTGPTDPPGPVRPSSDPVPERRRDPACEYHSSSSSLSSSPSPSTAPGRSEPRNPGLGRSPEGSTGGSPGPR